MKDETDEGQQAEGADTSGARPRKAKKAAKKAQKGARKKDAAKVREKVAAERKAGKKVATPKAAKVRAKAPPKAKREKGPPQKVPPSQLVETLFGTRSSFKSKLLGFLVDNKQRMIDARELMKNTYGKGAGGEKEKAFSIRIRDLRECMEVANVNYELRRNKEGKEISFGLYPTK